MTFPLRACICSTLLISLASCTALPSSGPADKDIVSKASVVVKSDDAASKFDYVLVEIKKPILPFFDKTFVTSFAKGFSGSGGIPASTLGVGDVVQVTVFEAQAGGLFIPSEAGSRPGNFISLPAQTVDRKGYITVPYAGEIKVVGRPVSDVQKEVQDRLANRAIEPQVIINTTTSRSGNVSVLGDVNAPAQLSLSPAGERVLDIISRAGGLSAPSVESYVTIERRGRKETALFKTIIDNPAENIYIQPGDTIYVNRERRTYSVFGATNSNGRVNFEESNLSLGEALGQVGGLLDSRADPGQVFLYRQVDRKTMERAGIDVSRFSADIVPVVFRANLRDPDAFFALQRFRMQDKDIIYVSNSASTEISKFLTLVNGISDTTSNVPGNALSVRNTVRSFSR